MKREKIFGTEDIVILEHRICKQKNDGDKKHSGVEIECQNTSESEDDNLEKNHRASKNEKNEEAS